MEKLTKKQRHKIYKEALDKIMTDNYTCGCEALFSSTDYMRPLWIHYHKLQFIFPEFNLFKPSKDVTGRWWSSDANTLTDLDFENRTLALMFCIEMTRP